MKKDLCGESVDSVAKFVGERKECVREQMGHEEVEDERES